MSSSVIGNSNLCPPEQLLGIGLYRAQQSMVEVIEYDLQEFKKNFNATPVNRIETIRDEFIFRINQCPCSMNLFFARRIFNEIFHFDPKPYSQKKFRDE